MALSNIKREPRREITKQMIGTVVFLGYLSIVYAIVQYIGVSERHPVLETIFGMSMIGLIIPMMVIIGIAWLLCFMPLATFCVIFLISSISILAPKRRY